MFANAEVHSLGICKRADVAKIDRKKLRKQIQGVKDELFAGSFSLRPCFHRTCLGHLEKKSSKQSGYLNYNRCLGRLLEAS